MTMATTLVQEAWRATFGITNNGFLPEELPLAKLPEEWEEWENLVEILPKLNESKTTRTAVMHLPAMAIGDVEDEAVLRRLYSVLVLVCHSYIWCKPEEPITKLPEKLAVPWYKVAEKLGIVPVLTHAAIDLWNWKLKDPAGEWELDNMELCGSMTGTEDEAWFCLVMTAIEAAGAPGLLKMMDLRAKIDTGSVTPKEAIEAFTFFTECLQKCRKIIARVGEKCQPEIFFNVLRPYLGGWNKDGMIYEGISGEPIKYKGGSAAQSSLIQAFDHLLGIVHTGKQTSAFFKEMRKYMPDKHHQFMDLLASNANIRRYVVDQKKAGLTAAYNKCIQGMVYFRIGHQKLTKDYVVAFIGGGAKGTGDTDIEKFIQMSLDETKAALIK